MSEKLCRLCGDQKSADDLVISLDQPTNILTFKEFIEYYCQLTLDPSPDLPQKVCKLCKVTIDKFAAFSCKVSETQKSFSNNQKKDQGPNREPNKVKDDNKNTADDTGVDSTAVESSPAKNKPAKVPASPVEKGPSPKKAKLDDFSEDDLLQEVSFQDTSISEEKKSRAIRHLEEIDRIFSVISENCEKIQIPDDEVKDNGEVPKEWLRRFDDFTSWQDFKYTCNHCQTKFETLFSYAQHCFNLPASERVLKCYLCKSTSRGISFLATYLNHMSREHFPHIKFCCINCSAVFCNMKQLSTHYQKQHFSETLVIYPCLDCGHYSHCISALRSHKQQHDPKP